MPRNSKPETRNSPLRGTSGMPGKNSGEAFPRCRRRGPDPSEPPSAFMWQKFTVWVPLHESHLHSSDTGSHPTKQTLRFVARNTYMNFRLPSIRLTSELIAFLARSLFAMLAANKPDPNCETTISFVSESEKAKTISGGALCRDYRRRHLSFAIKGCHHRRHRVEP